MYSENVSNIRREKVIESNVHQGETVEHLQRRVDELIRENEELRQKTQVVIKKVETNIVEKTPGMDEETARRITDLETRLSESELLCQHKIREIEELESKTVRFNSLQGDFEVLQNRNNQLEQQLNEKILELEAMRKKYAELEDIFARDKEIIGCKDAEIFELRKRIKDLELLPDQVAEATRRSELLSVEISKLNDLAKQRDQEIEFLRSKIAEVESLRCIDPSAHDELKNRLAQLTALEAELADLKNKYAVLCTEREKEIAMVRSQDKEIHNLEKALHQNVKESRKLLDQEISNEEKLEREVEILSRKLSERQVEIDDWRRRAAIIPDLEKQIKHLEAEMAKFQDRYRVLEETNSQLKVKVDALNSELYSLRDTLKQREAYLAALEKDKMALVAEFEKSQKESSAMLTKVTQSKNVEIEKLTERTATYDADISQLQKSIAALKSECDHLNSEKIRIAKELEAHTLQERDLFAKIEALKNERALLTKEITDLVAEKDRLRGAVVTMEKEEKILDRNAHALSEENARLNALIADLENKLALNSSLITERDTEIANLKDMLTKIQHTHTALVKERDNLVLENASIVKKLTELETSYSAITIKYNKLEKIYSQIKGAAANLEEVQHQLEHTAVETEKISHAKEKEVVQQKTHFKEEVQERRF